MVDITDVAPREAERRLVDGVLSRDRRATEAFVRRYEPVLRRFFESRWRGAPRQESVDDAVQEAVFECLRPGGALSRLDLGRVTELAVSLRGIAAEVAARAERREASLAARWGGGGLGFDHEAVEAEADGEDPFVEKAVRTAVGRLDGELAVGEHSYGELVRLLFREGLPVREIAARWDLSSERVHELRRRACGRLRRLLGSIGIDSIRRGH